MMGELIVVRFDLLSFEWSAYIYFLYFFSDRRPPVLKAPAGHAPRNNPEPDTCQQYGWGKLELN